MNDALATLQAGKYANQLEAFRAFEKSLLKLWSDPDISPTQLSEVSSQLESWSINYFHISDEAIKKVRTLDPEDINLPQVQQAKIRLMKLWEAVRREVARDNANLDSLAEIVARYEDELRSSNDKTAPVKITTLDNSLVVATRTLVRDTYAEQVGTTAATAALQNGANIYQAQAVKDSVKDAISSQANISEALHKLPIAP